MNKGAQPAKLWSIGPMFRYERPQKGRYRQFVQFDIEALGAQDAYVDLEVIDFSMSSTAGSASRTFRSSSTPSDAQSAARSTARRFRNI